MNRRTFLKSTILGSLFLSSSNILKNTFEESLIRVAYFRADVTPPLGSPSYPSYKPLEQIEHPLLAKGVIIESNQQRYVICAIDWCEICNASYEKLRKLIATKVKTNPINVIIHTVHQHTAPMCDESAFEILKAIESPPPYPQKEIFDELFQKIINSIENSLTNFIECNAIGIGKAKVSRVASNRRILQPDGTCLTRFSSCKDPKLIEAPEGLIDPYLKTISFYSLTDKPIVRLHFYATHPQSFYGDPRVSYDFPGMAREEMEKQEEVPHIYLTGCAGDIAAGKYNDGRPEAREYLYRRLLTAMQQSTKSSTKQDLRNVELKSVQVYLGTRTEEEYSIEKLTEKMKDSSQSPNYRIGCAMKIAWINRANSIPIDITALNLGTATIVNLPGEPMIDFQIFAQQCAPDKFVCVSGYGDCAPGYICTEESFKQGGYEPSAANVPPSAGKELNSKIYEVLS
ncbi:MAG: hypothetical protein N3G21_05215 [Candidatus Hydrogenedentes bacterium]|nr:hypothetical protein [Candidatus Hydrogenedentota bacterium]